MAFCFLLVDQRLSPFLGGSRLLFVCPPQTLFDFQGQGVEQVLLHHEPTAFQQRALSQLHRQALQAVPSQLYLRQIGQLSHPGGQGLQHVVSQVQGSQLPALEQLWWETLNLKERNQS